MSQKTLTITPADSTVALDLASGTNGIWLAPDGLTLPIPTYEETFAESPETEGGRLVHSHAQNPTGTVKCLVLGQDAEDFWLKVGDWQKTVEEVRERGGALYYLPENGESVTYDLASLRITAFPQAHSIIENLVGVVEFEFTTLPYGRLSTDYDTITDLDPFNRDTFAEGRWSGDTDDLLIQNGVLIPASTANKSIFREITVEDSVAAFQFTMGASVSASWAMGIIAKSHGDKVLVARIANGGDLAIYRFISGTPTLVHGETITALSANTTYWLRFGIEGSNTELYVYTSDPWIESSDPLDGFSYTLTGTNATHFGTGVKGNPGLYITPKGTDEVYRAWRLNTAWIESALPVLDFAVMDVPGSVSALPTLTIGDAVTASGESRNFVEYGEDDQFFNPEAPPPVILDSDSLTGINAAVDTVTGAYDPDGTGDNVLTAPLTSNFVSLCSTGQQPHSGSRKIDARVYGTGNGPIFVRLQWRLGDGTWQPKSWVEVPSTGNFYELPLGTINIPVDSLWEGRLQAFSESDDGSDTLSVDYIEVLPSVQHGGTKTSESIQMQSLNVVEQFDTGGSLNSLAIDATPVQPVTKPVGTGADLGSIGSVAWSGTSNILTDDGVGAEVFLGPAPVNFMSSHYLKATNFSFAVPDPASTILGIRLDVKKRSEFNSSTSILLPYDSSVNLVKAGSIVPDVGKRKHKSGVEWQTSWSWTSYGGPTDMWGATWTPAQINANDFGAAIAGSTSQWGGLGLANHMYVDHMIITVYYKDSGGQTWETVGDTGDFTVSGGAATRSVASDDGRVAIAGTNEYASTGAAVTVSKEDQVAGASEQWFGGVAVRMQQVPTFYPTDFLSAGFYVDNTANPFSRISVQKVVSAVTTEINHISFYGSLAGGRRIWLQVDDTGNYFVYVGDPPRIVMAGFDQDLIDVMPDGKVGFQDMKQGVIAGVDRSYRDFQEWTPDWPIPVLEASGELSIAYNGVRKQNGTVPEFTGAYPRTNPAGLDGKRSAQFVVKARRNNPHSLPDDPIDDPLRASLVLVPRVIIPGTDS